MPHARIDMHRTLQPMMADISAAILRGMVTGFEMPADDLFQIFRLHDSGELVFSPTFPNHDRDDIIFIDLLANVGYSDDVKQRTMAAIADEMATLGIKRENLLLVVNDVHGGANWYAAGPPEGAPLR
jgi:tautomerase-like protein